MSRVKASRAMEKIRCMRERERKAREREGKRGGENLKSWGITGAERSFMVELTAMRNIHHKNFVKTLASIL